MMPNSYSDGTQIDVYSTGVSIGFYEFVTIIIRSA